MEALQHLRMMDEQSKYEMEALQNANDLLAEKEKEIEYLEAKVEFYRNNFPNKMLLENTVEKNSKCRQLSPFFLDTLCAKYPSVNFLKVDIYENTTVANDENVRFVPTFKIPS
ncbi:hypothetical protein RYX36_033282 [Vicia faba]